MIVNVICHPYELCVEVYGSWFLYWSVTLHSHIPALQQPYPCLKLLPSCLINCCSWLASQTEDELLLGACGVSTFKSIDTYPGMIMCIYFVIADINTWQCDDLAFKYNCYIHKWISLWNIKRRVEIVLFPNGGSHMLPRVPPPLTNMQIHNHTNNKYKIAHI